MNKLICVLGHPRSGTGYTSKLLRHFGVDVGHERLRRDGIAAWMFAVKCERKHWAAGSNIGINFQYYIHVIREPIAAISSIAYTENKVQKSLNFRKQFIEIDSSTNTVEQAVQSYIQWNQLIENINPEITLTLESSWYVLPELLSQRGLEIDKSLTHSAPRNKVNQRKHVNLSLHEIESRLSSYWKNQLHEFIHKYKVLKENNIKICSQNNQPQL